MTFKKRIYGNIKEFAEDILFPVRNRNQLKKLKNDKLLSTAFRERLMLAVTAVNGCRYCSYFHTKLALKSGISPAEINKLISGDIEHCPEEECMAIMYAQHWAESNACPDPEILSELMDSYGTEKVEAIHLTLRMIRMGNLMGNSWDYLLHRISFGRLK